MSSTTVIYTGTENGLYTLAHTGRQWRLSAASLSGKNVVGVTLSANNPAAIYAAVGGYGLFKTEDGGLSWQQTLSVNAHCLLMDDAQPGRLWVGCEPPGLHYSPDGGQSWQDLSGGLMGLPSALDWTFSEPPFQARLRVLARVPDQADSLLAGIQIGGLYRSQDGGLTWQPSGDGLEEDLLALEVHPGDPAFWLAATAGGLYRSEDGGQSWGYASDAIRYDYISSVAILPSGLCLASAMQTKPGHWVENMEGALYRSADRAQSWQPAAFETRETVSILTGDPTDRKRVYAATLSGAVYLSQDEGASWQKIGGLSSRVNTLLAALIG
jgi:photosystem II stability/assembly factor-like uncharacterized protein